MPTKAPKLVLSNEDFRKLSALVASQNAELVEGLEEEISRAAVLPAADLPEDVVSMDSAIKVRDLDSGGEHEYRLVFPHEANASEGRISVLAPLGIALIGLRSKDEYEFLAPNRKRKRFRVLAISSAKARKSGAGRGNIA
jgi:regulator of nucleoside diphosphate kinase